MSALLTSICNALLGNREAPNNELDFDMEKELERQIEEELDKDCIAEIDRYRRIDEWAGSFQNIYSQTALKCQQRLMEAKLLDLDIVQFLQYTRAGTLDQLRLKAFDILVDFRILQHPEFLTWFIYTMSTDISPWIRRNLHRMFGIWLATVAFGEDTDQSESRPSASLVIEQESSTEARQAQLARKQTVPGAIEALKRELGSNKALKEALWAACNYPRVNLFELSDFVEICGSLYEPRNSVIAKLKYPRYWKTQHLGNVSLFLFRLSGLIVRQRLTFL